MLSKLFVAITLSYATLSLIAYVSAVYPYVVAGSTDEMLPDTGAKNLPAPPLITDDLHALEGSISQILQEADAARKDALAAAAIQNLEKLHKSRGPGAASYLTPDGAEVAASLTIQERFSTEVARTITAISVLSAVPSLWFIYSGGAAQLHRYYCQCIATIGLHAFTLAFVLNAELVKSQSLAIVVSFVVAALVASLEYTTYRRWTWYIAIWFAFLLLLVFIRSIPVIGNPFLFVGILPYWGPVTGFYAFLGGVALIATYASRIAMKRLSVTATVPATRLFEDSEAAGENMLLDGGDIIDMDAAWSRCAFNSFVISFTSAVIAVSGIAAAIVCVIGRPVPLDYLSLFSVPATLFTWSSTAQRSVTYSLCLLLGYLVCSGAFTHWLRYKQFGISSIDDAAPSDSLAPKGPEPFGPDQSFG